MKVGMDVLCERHVERLRGKRIGLLSHQAALVGNGASSACRLRQLLGHRLVALFGPEHGFLGQAGPGVHTHTQHHPHWNIPIHSLYGEHRKPSPETLAGIDAVVCDLQDLGIRCYTYLATLQNMLAACCELGIEVFVADRPIPLPKVVDGPMVAPLKHSFVAPCPLPMVYGMTPGETASWLRDTCYPNLRLTVIPMEGWRRQDAAWDGARPAYIPPSPGIKTWESAMTYAATVFTEALTGIDCGRGTNLAFRILGAPWLEAVDFCERLKKTSPAGVTCHPYRYVAATGAWKDRELDGVRLTVTDPAAFRPVTLSLALLRLLTDRYGRNRVWRHKGSRSEWFDKLYGESRSRERLLADTPVRTITSMWERERRTFTSSREKVLLYS